MLTPRLGSIKSMLSPNVRHIVEFLFFFFKVGLKINKNEKKIYINNFYFGTFNILFVNVSELTFSLNCSGIKSLFLIYQELS